MLGDVGLDGGDGGLAIQAPGATEKSRIKIAEHEFASVTWAPDPKAIAAGPGSAPRCRADAEDPALDPRDAPAAGADLDQLDART